jgi:hypothetical protein
MATHRSRRFTARDDHAGALIEEMCTERAWGPADLARATKLIAASRADARFEVSRRTIERIVNDGHIPGARLKCGIALALDVSPWQLWGPGALPLAHQRQPVQVAA